MANKLYPHIVRAYVSKKNLDTLNKISTKKNISVSATLRLIIEKFAERGDDVNES